MKAREITKAMRMLTKEIKKDDTMSFDQLIEKITYLDYEEYIFLSDFIIEIRRNTRKNDIS